MKKKKPNPFRLSKRKGSKVYMVKPGARGTRKTFRTRKAAITNPRGVKIYGKLIRIEAQKTQLHICDAECKAINHRYYHTFKPGSSVYGMPDGSLLIK